MKTARYLILLVTLSFIACARSNYEDLNRNPAVDELGTCDIRFASLKMCAELIWETKPTETDFGSFVLEFYNPKDRSQFMDPPSTLSVTLLMPSLGHGSSPMTLEKLTTGQFRVSKVFFTMHGDWQIQLKLQNAATIIDQAIYAFHY